LISGCRLLLQVRVQLLPEEQRPDFSAMLGGVQLQQVFLTLRSKTDRLVLRDASMALTAGQAAIITSELGNVHDITHVSMTARALRQCTLHDFACACALRMCSTNERKGSRV
jgi:hypothetical protein